MAEGKKVGEGMLAEMAKRGLEELRSAVLQQPAQEAPSYQQQLEAAAARAPATERSRGMER